MHARQRCDDPGGRQRPEGQTFEVKYANSFRKGPRDRFLRPVNPRRGANTLAKSPPETNSYTEAPTRRWHDSQAIAVCFKGSNAVRRRHSTPSCSRTSTRHDHLGPSWKPCDDLRGKAVLGIFCPDFHS